MSHGRLTSVCVGKSILCFPQSAISLQFLITVKPQCYCRLVPPPPSLLHQACVKSVLTSKSLSSSPLHPLRLPLDSALIISFPLHRGGLLLGALLLWVLHAATGLSFLRCKFGDGISLLRITSKLFRIVGKAFHDLGPNYVLSCVFHYSVIYSSFFSFDK